MLANFITHVSSLNHSLFSDKDHNSDENVAEVAKKTFRQCSSAITCLYIEGDAVLVGSTQGLVGFIAEKKFSLRTDCYVTAFGVVNNKVAITYSNVFPQVWICNDNQTWACHSIDTQKIAITSLKLADTTLFLGDWDGKIFRIEIPSFELVNTLERHTDCVCCLEFYDEKTLVAGSNAGTLVVWPLQNEDETTELNGHTQEINAIICTQNKIISASNDCTIRIWERDQNWDCIHVLKSESNVLCLQSINARIFTGNIQAKVIEWRKEQDEEKYSNTELLNTKSSITCMQLSDKDLFLGTYDGKLIQLTLEASSNLDYLLD